MEVLCFLPSTHYPLYDFDLRATHARTLLPAAVASVSFGFVLVRVRVLRGYTLCCCMVQGNSLYLGRINYATLSFLSWLAICGLPPSFIGASSVEDGIL